MAPRKQTTIWKQAGTTSDVDAEGVMHTCMHLIETTSGEDFTISFSGRGKASAVLFIGALQAAAEILHYSATGNTSDSSVTFTPNSKAH